MQAGNMVLPHSESFTSAIPGNSNDLKFYYFIFLDGGVMHNQMCL